MIFKGQCGICLDWFSSKSVTDKGARDPLFDHLKDKHGVKLR